MYIDIDIFTYNFILFFFLAMIKMQVYKVAFAMFDRNAAPEPKENSGRIVPQLNLLQRSAKGLGRLQCYCVTK